MSYRYKGSYDKEQEDIRAAQRAFALQEAGFFLPVEENDISVLQQRFHEEMVERSNIASRKHRGHKWH